MLEHSAAFWVHSTVAPALHANLESTAPPLARLMLDFVLIAKGGHIRQQLWLQPQVLASCAKVALIAKM
jgi:hypothetical protein